MCFKTDSLHTCSHFSAARVETACPVALSFSPPLTSGCDENYITGVSTYGFPCPSCRYRARIGFSQPSRGGISHRRLAVVERGDGREMLGPEIVGGFTKGSLEERTMTLQRMGGVLGEMREVVDKMKGVGAKMQVILREREERLGRGAARQLDGEREREREDREE